MTLNNQVTDLRDANGLVTHIERNGAGQPTAIVGPYGQRTTLALDGNGFLSSGRQPGRRSHGADPHHRRPVDVHYRSARRR